MKRQFCVLLCFLMILSGCSFADTGTDTTAFYYCRADYAYDETYSVIASEQREVSENASDIKNLLALYLVGPLDESLTTPFMGAKLVSVKETDNHLQIVLADADKDMTDARFSLASACMTMTCLELLDVSQVTISCGSRKVTMGQDNLLLHDNITTTEIQTEESQ